MKKKSRSKNKKHLAPTKIWLRIGAVLLVLIVILITVFSVQIFLRQQETARLNAIDEQRFERMKSSVEKISKGLQTVTQDDVKWELRSSCDVRYKFGPDSIHCYAMASSRTPVASVDDVRRKIDTYTAFVDSEGSLLQAASSNNLYPDLSQGLGANTKELGSSTAFGNRSYREKETNIDCLLSYEITHRPLDQQAYVDATLTCRDEARDTWFF